MRHLASAILFCTITLLYSCGGHQGALQGSSASPVIPSTPGSRVGPLLAGPGHVPPVQPLSRRDQVAKTIPAKPLADLPGTVPPQPADIAAAVRRAASRAPQAGSKQTSAVVISIPPTPVSATSPAGGGTAHAYKPQAGLTWTEAQDTSVETEYHITGDVNSLTLLPDGVSYATIGLVDWFAYDYALNQTAPPQSTYLLNQSLYLHIRHESAYDNFFGDGQPVYLVRFMDNNKRFFGNERLAEVPFHFDLKLLPTNPIVSTPAVAPYSSHQIGNAFLDISDVNGATSFGPLEYGNDNWGWRTAAGPEAFDMASGGVTLMGQTYSSGAGVTSSLNFDGQFISGPVLVPQPPQWYCRGHNRTRQAVSPVNGPQGPAGILWSVPTGVGMASSSPALDSAGNVYFSAGDTVYSIRPDGSPNPGWPYAMAGGVGFGAFSSTAVGVDGTVYSATADNASLTQVYAINPDGSPKWSATLPGSACLTSLLEAGSSVYVIPLASPSVLYVLDKTTGAPVPALLPDASELNGVAMRSDGSRLYVNTNTGVAAYTAAGVPLWAPQFTLPGGDSAYDAMPAVAPDGTIFVESYGGFLYAIKDNGVSGSLNLAFGGTGFVGGGFGTRTPAIYDLGGGAYRVITCDNPAGTVRAYDQTGALLWTAPGAGDGYNAPAVGADGKVYVTGTDGKVLCYDGGTGAPVWARFIGGPSRSTPAIADDGTLYVTTTNGRLVAISDSAPAPMDIDPRSLSDASFVIYDSTGTPLTVSLDTDFVYDISALGFAPGSQFYLGFQVDPAASPNDLLLYPSRPDGLAAGLITVNAGSLTIPASLTPYFDNPVGTRDLVLKPNAYNRIQNDVSSLGHALYTFFDTGAAATFSPALDTDLSPGKAAVLAANVNYQVRFAPDSYPEAGADGAFLGSPETIYPQYFNAGHFMVGFGTLAENDDGLAGPNDDNTEYYTQVGMVNTLDSDAYCRFETKAAPTMLSDYGFFDATISSWIVIPSFPFGREPLAQPFDTCAFIRGTVFQVSDGTNFSPNITVNPGLTLDVTGYPNALTAVVGGSSVDLRPLPARVADDPAQPDPGQPGADVTGSGPWTVPLDFVLQYGQGPWTVEVDADYGGAATDTGPGTPAAWDNGTPGRVYAVTGSPFATVGLKADSVTIPNTQPAGSYLLAIRVTDAVGSQYTYVWPTAVTLNNVPTLTASLVANPLSTSVGFGPPVVFTYSAAGGTPGYNFDLDFGDGSPHFFDTANGSTTYSYTAPSGPGGYTATLTVTDAALGTAVATQTILVNP